VVGYLLPAGSPEESRKASQMASKALQAQGELKDPHILGRYPRPRFRTRLRVQGEEKPLEFKINGFEEFWEAEGDRQELESIRLAREGLR